MSLDVNSLTLLHLISNVLFCGDGTAPAQLPSEPVAAKNLNNATAVAPAEEVPFIEPTRDTATVVHDRPVAPQDSDDIDKVLQDSKNNVPVDSDVLDIN